MRTSPLRAYFVFGNINYSHLILPSLSRLKSFRLLLVAASCHVVASAKMEAAREGGSTLTCHARLVAKTFGVALAKGDVDACVPARLTSMFSLSTLNHFNPDQWKRR